MESSRLPTLFVPHGAGPCFFMDWEPEDVWDAMADWLSGLEQQAGGEPRALLVISAHWETRVSTVNVASAPGSRSRRVHPVETRFPGRERAGGTTFLAAETGSGFPHGNRASAGPLHESVRLTGRARRDRLAAWSEAPGGRASHPREEHLLPLYVVAGAAADEPGVQVLRDRVIGSVQSAFRFGVGG